MQLGLVDLLWKKGRIHHDLTYFSFAEHPVHQFIW
jgi:hypothetical protein